MLNAVGQRIVDLACKNGVSNQALCRILNAGRNHIQAWKEETSKPTAEEVSIVAKHFNVSTDYLLGLTDNPVRWDATPTEEHWLVKAYGQASDNIQRSIKAQLEPYMEETAQETNPAKKAM